MVRQDFRQRDNRNGAAMVETAIVMPVFLLVIWGTLEFGRAMMVGQLTTTAARYGARQAILDGASNSTVTADVKQFLAEKMKGIQQQDVSVEIAVTPGSGNRDPGNQLAATCPRDVCKVSVSIPYRRVAYFTPQFLNETILRADCSMRRE